jgi:hypothetical protein
MSMAMDNFAENIRDKSPPVTDPEALAVALSNVGTMSPRLRKLYDDAAALLRAQADEIASFTPLRARGVVDADNNLDCWDIEPFAICKRHVESLNQRDPAAMWRVVELWAVDLTPNV